MRELPSCLHVLTCIVKQNWGIGLGASVRAVFSSGVDFGLRVTTLNAAGAICKNTSRALVIFMLCLMLLVMKSLLIVALDGYPSI